MVKKLGATTCVCYIQIRVIIMNSIFGMFMESLILGVSCKVNVKPESGLLQSKWSHLNIPKIEFIAYIYILL